MRLTIKKKIGNTVYPFTVEGKNLHEVVMEAKKLSFYDIHKCGLCGSENLILSAHVAQGKYKYTEIKCLDCKGQLTFGQTQEDPDIFYLRKDKQTKKYDWKKYEGGVSGGASGGVNDSSEDSPF